MAKRIAQSSVNWVALAERVPAEQRVNLAGFKIRSDGYLRRLVLTRIGYIIFLLDFFWLIHGAFQGVG